MALRRRRREAFPPPARDFSAAPPVQSEPSATPAKALLFPFAQLFARRAAMLLCLFEDDVSTLEPLTLTRAAFDLRCGQTRLRDKHLRHFGGSFMGPLVRRSLAGFYRPPVLFREEHR